MKFLIFFVLIMGLNAQIKSYSEIKNEPKSLAKDYYIYRILTETKFNKAELGNIRSSIYRDKGKLNKELNKYFKPKIITKKGCAKFGLGNILEANSTCTSEALSHKVVAGLNKATIDKIIAKFGASSEQAGIIAGMQSPNPLEYFIAKENVNGFFNYYHSLGTASQNAKFNVAISPSFASKLGKYAKFDAFMQDLMINSRLYTLRQSLSAMNADFASGEGAFWAGLNAAKFGALGNATELFDKAATTITKSPHKRDNARYWAYLTSGDSMRLNALAKSNNINLYSLLAKEAVGNRQIDVIIPTPSRAKIDNYDITDPFAWVKTKAKADKMSPSELKNFAAKFDTKETTGEWAYMMNRATGYRDNYYPMPFMEHIGSANAHRKALILAIARQESRFVPASVSISYALGMMQFMPFVANDIAKNHKISGFDQDDMFKPEVAYKFANIHLDYLEKYLKSPVFIAYAYNGGLGFTRKTLKKDLFKRGKFEPFMSMELVPYAESREYGKRVLGNYIIYRQILDPNAKLSPKTMLDDLLNPAKSDNVR